MTLIDTLAGIGPIFGLGGCSYILFHFTTLPFWAVLLISVPVGGVIGIAGGIGLGMMIEFLFMRRKNKK
jgi:hypothetical protein